MSVEPGGTLPDPPPAEPVDEEPTGPLPEAVRARIVALAADALGVIAAEHLPAALRRVAGFAPNRRARLAGNQIAGLLETDADFRERVAVQARTTAPELVTALEAGTVPAAADPVETAALAWLVRPPGWAGAVERAVDTLSGLRAEASQAQVDEQVDRLRRRLDEAAEELRVARQRAREQLAEQKAENTELRRKLGEARARLRGADEARVSAVEAAEAARAAAAAATATAESEGRRWKARLEEVERELAAARRTTREDRDAGTLRARVLLDTLLGAAQGLRRELALPTVSDAPAAETEARVEAASSASPSARPSSGTGSLAGDDPALLEQLLAMPRARLLVDGYNVTKTAWPEASLEIQRDRLLAGLASLVARSGVEATVVFDAAETTSRPPVTAPRGVRVLFSPPGVIADDVLRELVAVEPPGRVVVLVSSDQALAADVRRLGARPVLAPALARLLARS